MNNDTKKLVIYLTVIITLIILIRLVYLWLSNENNINEGFVDDDDDVAVDLLTKLKSSKIQKIETNSTIDIELSIKPWSTKLYNLQNFGTQSKAISIYKPILNIKGSKYYKLGDMLSQNLEYVPDTNEFTLLIKKDLSDTKPPDNFNLVVNFGDDNVPITYYQYSQIINNVSILNKLSENITTCVNSFSKLNNIIKDNLESIKTKFNTDYYISTEVLVYNSQSNGPNHRFKLTDIMRYIKYLQGESIDNASYDAGFIANAWFFSFYVPTFIFSGNNFINVPPGTDIHLVRTNNVSVDVNVPITINNVKDYSVDNNNDNSKDFYKNIVQNNLPSNLSGVSKQNLTLITVNKKLFNLIDPNIIITYLNNLCTTITTIYNTLNTNTSFTSYLNLAISKESIVYIQNTLQTYKSTNTERFVDFFNSKLSSYKSENTLIASIINIILTMEITYTTCNVGFTPSQLGVPDIKDIKITGFNGAPTDTITSSQFDITTNYSSTITNFTSKYKTFMDFNNAIQNKTLNYFPIKIYEPIAPEGYVSLGHVFTNSSDEINKIISSNSVACVPVNCVKEIREWRSNDKVFEYNDSTNNMYWALFFNPYIGTFISVNKKQLPNGKVCKVVACVKKCTVVDDLKKADDCARKYYNMNKSIQQSIPLTPKFATDEEESFYLTKIKNQSDNLAKLKQRAQQLQTDIDKSTIITREMNKNKLQTYVDKQKRNIDLVMKRIEDDKNKIQTDISIPLSVINEILKWINDNSNLTVEQKTTLTNAIINNKGLKDNGVITNDQYRANLNNILKSCPQYDLTGLVKKNVVSDVCYGCDQP
jgi:hypothetical protein